MDAEAPKAELEFRCSTCGERLEVNDSMRTALLANGCVVCGSSTGPEDFVAVQ